MNPREHVSPLLVESRKKLMVAQRSAVSRNVLRLVDDVADVAHRRVFDMAEALQISTNEALQPTVWAEIDNGSVLEVSYTLLAHAGSLEREL